ncbi:hypothetical protein L873DRAFT_799256 [Choiromyces venosus 120613-1]|uniref:Uncharacterized protein n=1 Tax=Choiromyces venosus 120613-1 TaxID=1336337 RepID=A0A3N4K4N2_9PEZI|nr:hypothetical protein L873DRAFT_799256 [Choiromyces venosus 120613-1]
MNILQHIPTTKYSDIMVTLNLLTPPDPSKAQVEFTYRASSVYPSCCRSSKKASGNPKQAWNKLRWRMDQLPYGFHEDGFTSGLRAGVPLGWSRALAWRSIRCKVLVHWRRCPTEEDKPGQES